MILVQIGQKWQALYMNTYVHLYFAVFTFVIEISCLWDSAEADETFGDVNMIIMFDRQPVASVCRNMIMCVV
jgi:hypothetical protein